MYINKWTKWIFNLSHVQSWQTITILRYKQTQKIKTDAKNNPSLFFDCGFKKFENIDKVELNHFLK